MNNLLLSHKRFLVSWIINFGLILVIIFLAGCASRRLVPIADGGLMNPELQRATKNENGVTVTVQASAWHGTPSDLDRYVTSLYVVIQNDTTSTLAFGYEDVMLFDENRTQYNALTSETVVKILQAAYQGTYVFSPFFSFYGSVFIGSGFFSYYPYYYPFYPWWDYPVYYQVPLDDIFNQALMPGLINPNAKLQGFIYFQRIPSKIKNVTLEIAWKVQGEEGRHKFSFPFAIEKSRK